MGPSTSSPTSRSTPSGTAPHEGGDETGASTTMVSWAAECAECRVRSAECRVQGAECGTQGTYTQGTPMSPLHLGGSSVVALVQQPSSNHLLHLLQRIVNACAARYVFFVRFFALG